MAKISDFTKTDSFGTDFLILGAKKTFIHLYKAFTKVSIFYHFDLKYYIYIKTDILEYIIGEILSQITLDHLDQYFFPII